MSEDALPFWKQDKEVSHQRQMHRLKELESQDAVGSNALGKQETRILVHMLAKVSFAALVLFVVSYSAIQMKQSFDTRTKARMSTEVATAIEAESMDIVGDVIVGTDESALGGKYIEF